MNYTQLFDAIQSYTENNFPAFTLADSSADTTTEQINRFIQQAEQRIYNTVQFPSIRKNMTGNLQANNKYLQAPNDFLAVYSLAVISNVVNGDLDTGTYQYLINKDVNFIRQAYPSPNEVGLPRHYALFGPAVSSSSITNELTFILGPTPSSNFFVELHYYYYPESIVTAGTTWLGDNLDSVLFYGSLVEAYTYMKGEPELLQLYNAKYMEALQMAKRLGDGMERQDAYRSGQVRVGVT